MSLSKCHFASAEHSIRPNDAYWNRVYESYGEEEDFSILCKSKVRLSDLAGEHSHVVKITLHLDSKNS